MSRSRRHQRTVADPMSTGNPDKGCAQRLEAVVRTAIANAPAGKSSVSVVRSLQPGYGTKFAAYAALYRLHARGEIRFGSDRRWRPRTAASDVGDETNEGSSSRESRKTRHWARRTRAGWLWTDTCDLGEATQSAICSQIRTLGRRRYGRSVAVFVRTAAARDLLRDRIGETGSLDISWRTLAETTGRWELAIIGIGLLGDREPGAGPEARMQGRSLDEIERRTRTLVHCIGDRRSAETSPDRRLARLARLGTPLPRAWASGISLVESGAERSVYEGMKARGLDPQPQWEIMGYRLDFALFDRRGNDLLALDVEVDGRYWHTDAKGRKRAQDARRDRCLEAAGWRVLRLWDEEIRNDLERCLDRIESFIESR